MNNRRRGNRSSSKHRASNRAARSASNTTHPQFEMLEPRCLLTGEPTIARQDLADVNDTQEVDFAWPGAWIVGRHVFYNESGTASPLRYDGNDAAINDRDDFAIATDKVAYLPGSGAATFANVSSYTKGINGIMVDIQGAHGDIGVDDFEFYRGNNNSQTQWTAAPPPSSMSVRSGAGVSGSDRVELVWGSDAVKKEWLLVIVRANDDTGVPQKAGWRLGIGDVFFFGNAVGDSGSGDTALLAVVNQTDELAARNNPASVVSNIPITNLFDYNRDGAVNMSDALVSRNNATTLETALRFMVAANPFAAPFVHDPPDLDIDNIADADETSPPGRVVVVNANGTGELVPLYVRSVPDYIAGEPLQMFFNSSQVRLYRTNARTSPISSGYQAEENSTLYAEVIVAGPVGVTLEHTREGDRLTDSVLFTGISSSIVNVDVPGSVSADDHRAIVALALNDLDDDIFLAAVEGRSVSFAIYKNDSQVGTVSGTMGNGIATAAINTSTVKGDRYKVIATFAGGQIESQEWLIEPGAPHAISYSLSKPGYAADGTDRIEITATIRDDYGNLVADNTPVNWLIEGYGRRFVGVHPNEIATVNGVVRATVLAPEVPGPQRIKISSGQAVETIDIDVAAVEASIFAPPSLNVNAGQSGVLTVQTNAADGTQVYWTLSNGAVRTMVSTVMNGESSIPIQSGGGRIGGCIVTAVVGSYMAIAQLPFVSDAPLQIRLQRPVISGDVTTDGFATVVHGAAAPLPFAPAVVQPRTVQVPYYAQTDVHITGQPGRTYLVDFENPLVSAPLARLLGLDPFNRITLNAFGQGQFILGSQGTLNGDLLAYEAADVRLRVRPVNLSNPLEPDLNGPVAVATATYVHHGLLTYTSDAFMSFFGADPQTGLGLATSVAGGIAGVGDIGALVKNAARGLGFSDVDPNYLEASLSGLGLATEAAILYGELPDTGISALKSLAAALGDAQAGKVLGLLWHRVLTNATDAVLFLRFVTRIVSDTSGFAFQVMKQVLTGEDVMLAAMRASDELGDATFSGLKLVSEAPNFGGKPAAQQIVKSLDTLQGNAKQYLKELSGADLERVFEHLGVILNAGKIDAAMLERLLSFDALFSASYTRLRFLEDLRLVADADGLESLAKQMISTTPNFRVGHLYELQAGARIRTQVGGSTIKFVVRISPEPGPTDIDFIIDGVYYQAKSGSIGSLDSVKKWIAKARADGATMIKYVIPGGKNSVPADILEAMAERGIQAEDIIDIAIP